MEQLVYDFLTRPGGRKINEDSVLAEEGPRGLTVAVADGLGAMGGGREASRAAVEKVCLLCREEGCGNREDMEQAVFMANQAVTDAQTPEHGGMTTLVFLVLRENQAVWAHVGDSRLYYFKDGRLVFRTLDHSVPQLAVFMDMITEDEIRHHPDRSKILRALGSDSFEPEIHEPVALDEGFHAFLLCTDGFWEYVLEEEMEAALLAARGPKEWILIMEQYLMQKACEDHDNYTAAAVFITGGQ